MERVPVAECLNLPPSLPPSLKPKTENTNAMKYTYQELSESGNWAMPQPDNVGHAASKQELRRALERWADTNDRYNDRRDASLMVWKGEHDNVTDLYPDFTMREGPRGGVVTEIC